MVLEEIRALKAAGQHKIFFFVDDNITSNRSQSKDFLRELAKLNIRWVCQGSIDMAHDEELLDLMIASGCEIVLIGFESLNPENLKKMDKSFNNSRGGFPKALSNLREKKVRLYATFVFGYDEDTTDSFEESVDFAMRHGFYITAFNHLTPFPGTPLYTRLQDEGRLLYDNWWLDDRYSYNKIPFQPKGMSPEELQAGCVSARASFYSWSSILKRAFRSSNRASFFMWRNFFLINGMHRAEIYQRDGFPLGDARWQGPLLKAN